MGDVLELFGAFLDFPDRPGPQKRSSSGLQRSSSGDVSSELEGFFVGLPVRGTLGDFAGLLASRVLLRSASVSSSTL